MVEHHLDMVVVGGSIPLAPTNFNELRGRAFASGPESFAARPRLGTEIRTRSLEWGQRSA